MTTEPEPAAGKEPLPSMLQPSRLEPVQLDLRTIILWGIAVWAVALVVMAVLGATGRVGGQGPAICVVGILLGGVGLLWERRRARREAASGR